MRDALLRFLDRLKGRDVSPAWVLDQRRRETTNGIEQSCSTWPWVTEDLRRTEERLVEKFCQPEDAIEIVRK